MNRDPLGVLTALRPSTDLDSTMARPEQMTLRERILADTAVAPHPARRSTTRRHRVAAFALATVFTSAISVGAAAATGHMPQAFTDAFSFWATQPVPGHSGVDPATAKRLATAPGPHGTVFSVLAAKGSDGYACTVPLFETPASAAGPGPAAFTQASGSTCQMPPAPAAFGTGIYVEVVDHTYTYFTPAGAASRAELRTSDGQVYPVVLVDGTFYGWFPSQAADVPRPVLTGYADDGTVLDRTTI